MIVQPDFLDHWKTRELIERTGNPAAPLAIIRLWTHCQHRMAWEFEGMDAARLSAVCHWEGNAKKFFDIMRRVGFINVTDTGIAVHDWDRVNASLIAAWNNGRLSKGRPRKTPPENNPRDTHGITHGIPMDNPRKTQSKVEKNRLEGNREDTDKRADPAGVKQVAPEKTRKEIEIRDYGTINDTANDPFDLASSITGDWSERGRAFWRITLDKIGQPNFRSQLSTLWGEHRQGERGDNPGAVLTARLKKLIEIRGGATQ